MRAGLSTIQQTLTPEAAAVLKQAMTEADRRSHEHTTPLHVAAALIASPAGFLRRACIRSHPDSSHPLQCRALELCFSVALDRLPNAADCASASRPGISPPPVSNSLMAALKRAQAHQRRGGSPEQQQQPLLAIKTDLEHLVMSILDDPGISRVMREASFSSPAVKSTIERSLCSSAPPPPIGLDFRQSPAYLNPRLQIQASRPQSEQGRIHELNRVIDILTRTRKRNPVLVGESEPAALMKELLSRIEKEEIENGVLKNAKVIPMEAHLGEMQGLGEIIETIMGESGVGGAGVILDLGDLKWVVESPEVGREAVAEMGRLLGRFSSDLWLVGTATCETFLRCQVYYPSMENDCDLQAVPIAPRAPPFLRQGRTDGSLCNSIQNPNPFPIFPPAATTVLRTRRAMESSNPAGEKGLCTQCTENYEHELAKLVAEEFEKSSSIVKTEAVSPPLPQWLQNAKSSCGMDVKNTAHSQVKDQELLWKQKTEELHKKWANACSNHHRRFQQELCFDQIAPKPVLVPGLYNSNLAVCQNLPSKLQVSEFKEETLQLNADTAVSPVRTDLVLGHTNADGSRKLDADSFKRLLKVLTQKVWWQPEAASVVAAALSQCKSSDGKHRSRILKGDVWLTFTGPDKFGKRKMASVLSDLVCGTNFVTISTVSHDDDVGYNASFRGKTTLDRLSEAVRRNPFSVIMIEDVDEANALLVESLKQAMESGRLMDSHGRDVSLKNAIIILATERMPNKARDSTTDTSADEEEPTRVPKDGWQLRLSVCRKTAKRHSNWLSNEVLWQRHTKPRNEIASASSFDLNLAADTEAENRGDGSHNSSDLTVDHEDEQGLEITLLPSALASCPSRLLLDSVDEEVVFRPVDLSPVRRDISNSILSKFSAAVGNSLSIEVEDEAVEKMLRGVWFGETRFEEWAEKVLVPSFHRLKAELPSSTVAGAVVQLESSDNSDSRSSGEWLPNEINVVIGALGL